MELTRKEMLKLGVLGSAALSLPLVGRVARTGNPPPLKQLPRPFQVDLSFPTAKKPFRSTKDTDFYKMTMKEGVADIIPGRSTPIWGYDGEFPGPTIFARKDRRIEATFTNELPVESTIHCHGAYVDGDSDGHPEDLIAPGNSKTYVYNNNENARFQWYHDHSVHTTAINVYKGLAGLYLIGDDFEDAVPCPKEEFDLPLVIQDRLFAADGRFIYPFDETDSSTNGVEGNVILVNGRPWPRLAVDNRRYRFRILNGSNARLYQLALSTGKPFAVIATEGGMLDKPVFVRSLPVPPAERFDIVVDFAEYPLGTEVILKNLRADSEGTANIMRFDVARRVKDDSTIPPILRSPGDQEDLTHQRFDVSDVVRTRRFEFKRQGGFWSINGKIWDPERIDAAPTEGDVEIWEFENTGGGWIHPIHLHLLNFKILSRNGRMPHPWERGWKETVFLDANDRVQVIMKWPKVPIGPSPGGFTRKYAFHCHVVEHEDHDMMLQFEVQKA